MDLQFLVTTVKSRHLSLEANWGRRSGRSVPAHSLHCSPPPPSGCSRSCCFLALALALRSRFGVPRVTTRYRCWSDWSANVTVGDRPRETFVVVLHGNAQLWHGQTADRCKGPAFTRQLDEVSCG